MMKKIIAIALATLSLSANAANSFYTGNDLLDWLRSNDGSKAAAALGYVAGVSDSLEASSVCTPRNVTLGQVRDVVYQKLEEAPQIRNYEAALIVQAVLEKTWPCKKPAKKKEPA